MTPFKVVIIARTHGQARLLQRMGAPRSRDLPHYARFTEQGYDHGWGTGLPFGEDTTYFNRGYTPIEANDLL